MMNYRIEQNRTEVTVITFLSSALLFPALYSPELSLVVSLPLQLQSTSGSSAPLSDCKTTAASALHHISVGMTTTSHVSPPAPLVTYEKDT